MYWIVIYYPVGRYPPLEQLGPGVNHVVHVYILRWFDFVQDIPGKCPSGRQTRLVVPTGQRL